MKRQLPPLLGIALLLCSEPNDGVLALQSRILRPASTCSTRGQGPTMAINFRLYQVRRQASSRDDNDREQHLGVPLTLNKTLGLSSRLLERTQTVENLPVPTTMSDAIRVFFFSGDCGPSWIVFCLAALCYWRMTLATTGISTSTLPLGWADGGVFGVAIVFWWFQEHVLHERVLHSSIDWVGKAVHQGHHDTPYYHVSIDPAVLLFGWMAVAHFVLFRWWLPLPLAVSGTVGYSFAGLFYEWAHYIVHTKVRFVSPFWRRVRDNHVRHHRICSDYWFAFSLPAIDDLFGTNPCVQDVQQRLKDVAKDDTIPEFNHS